MAGTFTPDDNDDSGWNSNKELNPQVNSSVTDDGLLEADDQEGDTSWREENANEDSGDPGATPGSAEGEDDPELNS